MDIRNGLITAYAGISASVGASSGISFYKSSGSYFNLFNNGRLWIGSGTPVDAGYQADIVGSSRVTGNWTVNNVSIYAANTNYLQLSSHAAATNYNYIVGVIGGSNMTNTGSSNVIIGSGLATNAIQYTGSFTLNAATYTSATSNIVITAGGATLGSATASNSIVIGSSNWNYIGSPTINNTVILGTGFYAGANWSTDRSIFIGYTGGMGGTVKQFIGLNSAPNNLEDNVMLIGNVGYGGTNNTVQINDVYYNNANFTGYAAAAIRINAGKAYPGGSNVAGVNITIASGRGTGTAAPGDIVFSTPIPTGSATSVQNLVDRWYVKGYTGTFTNKNISYSGSTAVIDVSGSVIITGSIFMSPSSSFVLPLTASNSPLIGSAYWSGSSLFIWNGTRYMSSSFA